MKKIFIVILLVTAKVECFSQNWSALGSGLDGWVSSIITDPNTHFVYAGGFFSGSGATTLNHVAFWDGLQWNPLGQGFNGKVYQLTFHNNFLYAVGAFTYSDTTAVNHIAKWNGSSWENVGGGLSDNVVCIYSFANDLFVGGDFLMAGNQSCKYVARWDGLSWHSLDTNITSSHPGYTMATIGSFQNKIIIGGDFTITGSNSFSYIAQLDSGIWKPLGTGLNSYPVSFETNNNELVTTGSFNLADSTMCGPLAKWSGINWTCYFNSSADFMIFCQAHFGLLHFFGGNNQAFNVIGQGFKSMLCYDENSSTWFDVAFKTGVTARTMALDGNYLYVGGLFDSAGSVFVNNIAKLDLNTVGIIENKNYSEISIFPNPANNSLNISFESKNNSPIQFSIYNALGEIALQKDLGKQQGEIKYTVDISGLPTGIYFLKLQTGGQFISRKFIKQ